ncbi:hypothetical protein HNP38_000110 [Chryseobacterium defluvii]|uniref:Uncharacterized protein n=1 Tax=Chryseobacterium defluvii TaxID=160396 RepID=A0A840KA30_9FLAO|nr:hypothetical protein [Chryseobacterium defluvii]
MEKVVGTVVSCKILCDFTTRSNSIIMIPFVFVYRTEMVKPKPILKSYKNI